VYVLIILHDYQHCMIIIQSVGSRAIFCDKIVSVDLSSRKSEIAITFSSPYDDYFYCYALKLKKIMRQKRFSKQRKIKVDQWLLCMNE